MLIITSGTDVIISYEKEKNYRIKMFQINYLFHLKYVVPFENDVSSVVTTERTRKCFRLCISRGNKTPLNYITTTTDSLRLSYILQGVN